MPTFKHTFTFQSNNGGTWTEIWYRDADSITSELSLPTDLQNSRLVLLDALNVFQVDRVSQLNAGRVTGINTINQGGKGKTTFTAPLGPSAIGWTAVINCVGNSGGSKRWNHRGWSSGDYYRDSTTGQDTVQPEEQSDLNRYLKLLEKYKFGILHLQASTVNINPYLPITKIDGTRGDGTTDITTSVAANFTTPPRLIIGLTSKKDTPGLNGHFNIIKQAPVAGPAVGTVFTIPYRTPNNGLVPNPQGRVRQEVYLATSVLNNGASDFSHLSTRTSRGGYRTSRGARRAQRLRLLA